MDPSFVSTLWATRYETCQYFYYYHVWCHELFVSYATLGCILCKTEWNIKIEIHFALEFSFSTCTPNFPHRKCSYLQHCISGAKACIWWVWQNLKDNKKILQWTSSHLKFRCCKSLFVCQVEEKLHQNMVRRNFFYEEFVSYIAGSFS